MEPQHVLTLLVCYSLTTAVASGLKIAFHGFNVTRVLVFLGSLAAVVAVVSIGAWTVPSINVLENIARSVLRRDRSQIMCVAFGVGIGLASYVEICGFGPWESSIVKVEPSGAVSVYTGISPHGQGQETSFAQIVADKIGANFDDIVVHHGDTDNTAQGQGTGGSRGLVVGGSALVTVTALMTLYVIPQLSQYKIAQAVSLLPS